MTNYCCGFMFDIERSRVALIRKVRPDWQAGKLNGIGGHIEAGESASEAMAREFFEETGYQTFGTDWKHFATLHGQEYRVLFYYMYGKLEELKTTTDEEIVIEYVDTLHNSVIPNLRFLIPMALANKLTKRYYVIEERG